MAKDGTISSKLQLDGEQQYKQALNDAYRSLRVLRSELKAETAELGRNATEQDKARTKMASLQKQIAQQEKIVKTLEKALADSRKEYADNQEVQDKWEEKLNKAREALANMQNALGDTTDVLSKFDSEMKSTAESSGQAAQTVISFNDAMKSIGNIVGGVGEGLQGIFTATLDTVQDIVAEMLSLMGMAWAAAGEWKDIQSVWGGNLESIERVYTGMELQGVDPGKVTSSMQKLVTNIHSGNKEAAAAMKELGLSEDMFSSHFDMYVAVMDRLSTEFYTNGQRHDLVSALFGEKKGSDAMLILDNWGDAMARYKKDVEDTGLALDSDEITKLDDVSHKITEIQELWNTVKTNIGAKLSEILNMDQLSEDALEIIRDIGAILNSEGDKRAELVLKLTDDVQTLFDDIAAALGNLSGFLKELGGNLKESENPIVRFIGQLIESLGGVLDWLSENSDTIIEWLNRLLPYMAVNKVSEATTGKGIGDWATDIAGLGLDALVLLKLFKGGGLGAGAVLTQSEITGAITGASGSIASAIAGVTMSASIVTMAVPVIAALAEIAANRWPSWLPDIRTPAFTDQLGKEGAEAFEEAVEQNVGKIITDPDAAKKGMDYLRSLVSGGGSEEAAVDPYADMPMVDVTEGPAIPSPLSRAKMAVTADQLAAAEEFWDVWKTGNATNEEYDAAWERMEEAFQGNEAVFDEMLGWLDKLYAVMDETQGSDEFNASDWENLPASWFVQTGEALQNLAKNNYRGDNDEDLPGRLEAAVERGSARKPTHVHVYIDGKQIIDYVDQGMAGSLSALFG